MNDVPIIVSYGAGTNSTALLVGLAERNERPDAIVFADTGGETPESYAYVETVDAWLAAMGWPSITRVRHRSEAHGEETLEANSLRTSHMPSIAYGFRSCSQKFKRDPQDRWARSWGPCVASWAAGQPVVKMLGFDADEPQRAARSKAAQAADATARKRWSLRYPLIEWGWGRQECVEAIARAGLPQPGKSACFFCPMSKPREVWALHDNHPELFARACAMEAAGEPFSGRIKGLGSYFSWRELVKQGRLFVPGVDRGEVPCDCFDGDAP